MTYPQPSPDRQRAGTRPRRRVNRINVRTEFINPWPYMPSSEARVRLWLEAQHLPYSWRYFDGQSERLSLVMPGYHPEFTLSEYRTVIIVLGTYFSQPPGVLDKIGLAKALLEADWWNVVVLWDTEVYSDVGRAIISKAPALAKPNVTGTSKPNPYGIPDLLSARRRAAKALSLRKMRFTDPEDQSVNRDPNFRAPRLRRDRRARVTGDSPGRQGNRRRRGGVSRRLLRPG